MAASRNIAVIGAGIVGIMCARSLQQRGHIVTLIDADEPAMGCSFGNAGIIACEEIWPLARPQVLMNAPNMLLSPLAPISVRRNDMFKLAPWFLKYGWACNSKQVRRGIDILSKLNQDTQTIWRQKINEAGLGAYLVEKGFMRIFEGETSYLKGGLERKIHKDHGIAFDTITGAGLQDIAPGISQSVTHACLYPAGMHITDPHRFANAMFEVFLNQGGRFVRDYVSHMVTQDDRVATIHSVAGMDHENFDDFVIAAGLGAKELLAKNAISMPLVAERGYHVQLDRNLDFDIPIASTERGFIMTPMSDGLRLAGTVEFAADAAPENWKRAELLLDHTKQLFPDSNLNPLSKWMGRRPTLPDYLPAISKAPRFENLYVACGHQHLGLTLSAITGELIADMIERIPPRFNMSALDSGRFT